MINTSGIKFNHRIIKIVLGYFYNSYQIIIAIAIFTLLLITVYEQTLSSFLSAVTFFLIGLIILKSSSKRNQQVCIKLFIIMYCFNIFMSNIIIGERTSKTGEPYWGSDDRTYEKNALMLSDIPQNSYGGNVDFLIQASKGLSHGSMYYTALLSVLISWIRSLGLEYHYLIFVYLNSLFVALTGVVIWKFGILVGLSSKGSQLAGLFSGFWPSYVFNSSMIRRDTIFIFFLVLSAYLFSKIFNRRINVSVKNILLLLASITIVSYLRIFYGIVYYLIFLFILYFLYRAIIRGNNYLLHYLSICLILMIVSISFYIIYPDLALYNQKLTFYYDMYTASRSDALHGGGIGSTIFTYSPIISIPLRLFYSFFSPPPIPNFNYIFSNYNWFGTIPWFFVSPFLFWTLKDIYKERNRQFMGIRIAGLFFIFIFISGQVISFSDLHTLAGRLIGILLIIYGIENWSVNLISVFSFLSVFGLYLTFFYLVVKIIL
jgi:hypothetical protein